MLSLVVPFLILSLFTVGVIMAWAIFQSKKNQKELNDCSEILHSIFKTLGETSLVTRILSQESPTEELERLKHLIEKRGQQIFLENDGLKSIFKNLPDGLLAVDASKEIVFCNQRYCEMMSLPPGPHEGKKLFEILRNHAALNAADFFLSDPKEIFSEIDFPVASEKIVQMKMIHLNAGSFISAIFIFSDISQVKKLEGMRRDFVANVSHELRTPITAIQGFAETLFDGADEDVATRKRFLGLIRQDTERLNRLTDDLLALSRIESQSRGFQKNNLNALAEINQALEVIDFKVKQKKLHIEKDVNKELFIHANRDQLRQVLINLFDNAAKFTREKGRIIISTQRCSNQGVEICVSDSGTGVHPDNHEKIFQRFFREDKARSRETGGTGLGLAIVKHIMEAHHGKVKCEAGALGGAIFTLYFPA